MMPYDVLDLWQYWLKHWFATIPLFNQYACINKEYRKCFFISQINIHVKILFCNHNQYSKGPICSAVTLSDKSGLITKENAEAIIYCFAWITSKEDRYIIWCLPLNFTGATKILRRNLSSLNVWHSILKASTNKLDYVLKASISRPYVLIHFVKSLLYDIIGIGAISI